MEIHSLFNFLKGISLKKLLANPSNPVNNTIYNVNDNLYLYNNQKFNNIGSDNNYNDQEKLSNQLINKPTSFTWDVTNNYYIPTVPIENFAVNLYPTIQVKFIDTNPIDNPRIKINEYIYNIYINNNQRPLKNRINNQKLCFINFNAQNAHVISLDLNIATNEEIKLGQNNDNYITPNGLHSITGDLNELNTSVKDSLVNSINDILITPKGSSTSTTSEIYFNINNTLTLTKPTVDTSYPINGIRTAPNIIQFIYTPAEEISISSSALYDCEIWLSNLKINNIYTIHIEYLSNDIKISEGIVSFKAKVVKELSQIPMKVNYLISNIKTTQLKVKISLTTNSDILETLNLETGITFISSFIRNGGEIFARNVFDVFNNTFLDQSEINFFLNEIKQNKNDTNLITVNKTVIGSINENKTQIDDIELRLGNVEYISYIKEGTITGANIDLATGNTFTKIIDRNLIFVLVNKPLNKDITILLKISNGKNFVVSWPDGTRWARATPPILSTGQDYIYLFIEKNGSIIGNSLLDLI